MNEQSSFYLKNKVYKIALAGIFTACGVLGSFISFPIFASKCAPVQHLINVLSAIFLGPFYSVIIAFSVSLLRNLLGLGTYLAFPGSMIGALLCSFIYYKTKNIYLTYSGELVGTGVLGALVAYPIAIFLMGKDASKLAYYIYIIPFIISSFGGVVIAIIVIESLRKTKILEKV